MGEDPRGPGGRAEGSGPPAPADAEALAAVFGAARAAAMPWLAVLHSAEEDRGFFAGAIADITDYIPGPDMGTDEMAMGWVRDETGRAVGLPRELGGMGKCAAPEAFSGVTSGINMIFTVTIMTLLVKMRTSNK